MKKYGARTDKDYKLFDELMELYEFEVIEIKKRPIVLSLRDLQGANLGDIESETFSNMYEILARMTIYHEDYIFDTVYDDFGLDLQFCDTWEEKLEELEKFRKEHKELEWTIDILRLIFKSEEIVLDN